MWEGGGAKFESSGYYFHLEPPNILLGVGIHMFSKDLLKAYREAVVDPVAGPSLVDAVNQISESGDYQLGGEHYKRVPRGYDPEHKYVEDLKRKDFVIMKPFGEDETCAADFLAQFTSACRRSGSFVEFLTRAVGLEY